MKLNGKGGLPDTDIAVALAEARDPSIIVRLEYIGPEKFGRSPGEVHKFEIFITEENVNWDGRDVRKSEPHFSNGNYMAMYADAETPAYDEISPYEWKIVEEL